MNTKHTPSTDFQSRAPGRPTTGTEPELREKILDAAATLFAEQGIAATPVRLIAERAGATPAMVHYYFKNKDRLVDTLIDEHFLPTLHAIWEPVVSLTDPDLIEGLVHRILEAATRIPWLPQLWLREFIINDGPLRERLLPQLPLDKIAFLVQRVRDKQQAGKLSPDIEPRLIFLSIMGMTLLPMASLGLWQNVFHPTLNPALLERHVIALLQHGLSTPP